MTQLVRRAQNAAQFVLDSPDVSVTRRCDDDLTEPPLGNGVWHHDDVVLIAVRFRQHADDGERHAAQSNPCPKRIGIREQPAGNRAPEQRVRALRPHVVIVEWHATGQRPVADAEIVGRHPDDVGRLDDHRGDGANQFRAAVECRGVLSRQTTGRPRGDDDEVGASMLAVRMDLSVGYVPGGNHDDRHGHPNHNADLDRSSALIDYHGRIVSTRAIGLYGHCPQPPPGVLNGGLAITNDETLGPAGHMLNTMRNPYPLTRRELALIAAFWGLYGFLMVANRLIDPGVMDAEPRLAAAAAIAFVQSVCWVLLTPFVFWLAGQWELDGVSRARNVVTYAAVGLVTAVTFGAIQQVMHAALFPPPPLPLIRTGPPPWFVAVNAAVMYLGVLAAGHARVYALRYQERREQAAKLQAELAQVHLDALRRQLDPHFLFNTLNAVSTLVERDPRGVRRMIARLSELLRHSLDGANVPEIPLRQELALLDCYLDIMRVRFQGRLTVETHVDGCALNSLVPSLILQPLVENAIRHGVERVRGMGHIEISGVVDGETVTLRVRDNGPGVTDTTSRRGVGLRNTVARLDRLYGARTRFTLQPADGGGTVAEVQLPFRSAEDHDGAVRVG
jgi:two-component system LytT family sensor kinase